MTGSLRGSRDIAACPRAVRTGPDGAGTPSARALKLFNDANCALNDADSASKFLASPSKFTASPIKFRVSVPNFAECAAKY